MPRARFRLGLVLALGLAGLSSWSAATVSAVDGRGTQVHLPLPASRVVGLTPHAVEMLYAIGAGSSLVGRVEYADWPKAAQSLPSVGSYSGLSLEAVLALRPQLVVVWGSGTSPRDVARLRQLGIPLFVSEPRTLPAVAAEMEALGVLTGHAASARAAATQYRNRLAQLAADNVGKRRLRVFWQLNETPLMTASGQQFMSHLLTLCGGDNVFAALSGLTPMVSTEAVLAARPEVMLAQGGMASLAHWRRWPSLPAVRHQTLYAVPADETSRPGPRLVEGAEAVCRVLDAARQGG